MRKYTPEQQINAFWNKVAIDESDFACWLWIANRNQDGYGMVRWGKKQYGAHRIAYQLAFGTISSTSLVCHHCDNPACVNPNHFFLGSNADNAHDRDRKGRQITRRGETRPNHKLSDKQIIEIRALHKHGLTYRQLAVRFNVSKTLIADIITRKTREYI